MILHRYPGARPFETEQKEIFFGRDTDTANLHRMILLEPLVVLYGKSGTGKSSMLNAGIIPRLQENGVFEPLRIRFNAWNRQHASQAPVLITQAALRKSSDPAKPVTRKFAPEEAAREQSPEEGQLPPGQPSFAVLSPVRATQTAVRRGNQSAKTWLDKLIPDEETLWHDLKEWQLQNPPGKGLLLIFDQFEELFSYPEDRILAFRSQLAEAMFSQVPKRYWNKLEEAYMQGKDLLTPEETMQLQESPKVRVLFVIRSDRLHFLNQLSDSLPTILKNCYELDALAESDARLAIIEPAGKKGSFQSRNFAFEPLALERILDFLSRQHHEKIAGTQLQIICQYVEKKVRLQNLNVVTADMVNDLDQVIKNYFDEKILAIKDPRQQEAAQRMIEEGMVLEEEKRRLQVYEGQMKIKYGVTPETLQTLTDSHLLRMEPSLQGGFIYELSHDSLVPAVLDAKEERRNREQAALFRKERTKRNRAIRAAVASAAITFMAFGTTIWALDERDNKKAEIEKTGAERKQKEKAYKSLEATVLQLNIIQEELNNNYKALQERETVISKKNEDLVAQEKELQKKIDENNKLETDRKIEKAKTYKAAGFNPAAIKEFTEAKKDANKKQIEVIENELDSLNY